MRSSISILCVLASLPAGWAQSGTAGPNSINATSITVTATRGSVEDAATSIPLVFVRKDQQSPASIDRLFMDVAAVSLQNTTPGQASPILRGLTGYQTLLLLDGTRLNTSIFRSGPNQYSAFVDTSQVSQAEVLLGPASAAYGSDAMGGTVQFLSPSPAKPAIGTHARRFSLASTSASGDLAASVAPRFGWDGARLSLLGSAFLRRHNNLRTGGGLDTHNVFTRYANYTPQQASALMGDRLPETAYTQAGLQAKALVKLHEEELLTFFYQRGEQYGLRAYRELQGGLGRLQALYQPQGLDLFYARYERPKLGLLDRTTLTTSFNHQSDGSQRQGVNYSDAVIIDRNSVGALGLAGQTSKQVGTHALLLFGADLHREAIASSRNIGPSQYPNGAVYTSAAPFAQATVTPGGGRLRLQGGLRWNRNGFYLPQQQLVPNLAQRQVFSSIAFNVSAALRLFGNLEFLAIASQGFRAPNTSDLAATGLTGLGFEIPAAVAAQAGAMLAIDASEAALPRAGQTLRSLGAERLNNYEAGLRLRGSSYVLRFQAFTNVLNQPIVRRTVLFPASAVPSTLNGIAITQLTPTAAQRAAGVVSVATAYDPRAVKTFLNDGGLRYQGFSAEAEWKPSQKWQMAAGYSYLNGREILPNRIPRRLPPQQGNVRLAWLPNAKVFTQLLLTAAGTQTRFSAADFDDERMGASRSRRDVQNFFRTPIGLSTPITGSVAQLVDQMLPLNALVNGVRIVNDTTKVPLYTSAPGWVRLDAHVGLQLAQNWKLSAGMENLLDRNYRYIGSGADSLGRSAFLRSDWSF